MVLATRRRPGRVAAALLLLTLVLRIGAVAAADGRPLVGDATDYVRHGESIAAGHGYPPSGLLPGHQPTGFRAPGYPYFLGAIFAVRDHALRAVRIVQVILGVLGVALFGWVAARLFGRRAGTAALALGAVYPPLVISSASILTEALFLPLAVGVIASALWAADAPRDRRRLVVVGLVVGLATLTRFTGFLLLVPAALIVARSRPGDVRGLGRWAPAGVVVAVVALCVAPWTIRNAVELHAFVPVALEEGVQLSGVMNDEARKDSSSPGEWRPPNHVPRYADLFARPGITEPQLDHALTSRALDYVKAQPAYVLKAVAYHSLRMLHLAHDRVSRYVAMSLSVPYWMYEVGRFAFYALFVMAIAGVLVVRRLPLWMWLTPLLFFALGAATAGLIRYRWPSDLFLVLPASAAIARLATGRGSEPRSELRAP